MKRFNTTFAVAFAALFLGSTSVFAEDVPAANAPAAVPAAVSPAAVPEGSIEVLRLVLTKEVVDREPGAEITSAAVGDGVVGWTQIRSGMGEVTVTHRWLHEGENMGDVPLVVRSSPWRTWSRKTAAVPGNWKFQVLNSEGAVLKEAAFTVTAAAPAAPPAAAPTGQ